ncbi:MAG: hypothetical protein WC663_01640 [Patescibacteria group bacterium]|jgi:hypothetical protein
MKSNVFRKIVFVTLFTIIGYILLQFPFTKIMGSSQAFTGFDFFAPMSGGFLGAIPAAISVLAVKLFNTIFHHQAFDVTNIIRLFPMVFAAIYFGIKKDSKLFRISIPVICMILFWLKPEGRQAWFFALYWLIPIACAFKADRLILKSLGSTFTAHAVGSVAFLYAFNLPASVWIALIPVVAVERGLFASGIWASYTIFNTGLNYLLSKKIDLSGLRISKRYSFNKDFFRKWA